MAQKFQEIVRKTVVDEWFRKQTKRLGNLNLSLKASKEALEAGQKTLNELYASDKRTGNDSRETAQWLIAQNKTNREKIKALEDEIKALTATKQ